MAILEENSKEKIVYLEQTNAKEVGIRIKKGSIDEAIGWIIEEDGKLTLELDNTISSEIMNRSENGAIKTRLI